MSEHTVLGIILGASIAGEIFAAIWIVWAVRDTSKYLARLIIQEGGGLSAYSPPPDRRS